MKRTRLAAGLAAVSMVVGCGSTEKKSMVDVAPMVTREVHSLLRGTVGSEASFRNVEPIVVSGLGLVVGLAGTGGDVLPDSVAATMEREMGLQGIAAANNYPNTSIQGMTPRQLLRDPNTAVVVVQAVIPPGLPEGASFDVFVRALNATSLEGGNLWSTDLRLGDPSTFGSAQTRQLAAARGPVFINPFAESGKEREGVTQTVGRVLSGGRATSPLPIQLMLDNSSHARARAIVSAINSRFPPMPGDQGDTARGRSASQIDLRVPLKYRDRAGDFLELVSHLPIDGSFGEEAARRLVSGVKSEPAMAEHVAWGLEAIGSKALPMARELYDAPDLAPRLAGLKAGARLNDARAATPLREVAKSASGSVRTRAIGFLGEMDGGPSVDVTLRELAGERDLAVRTAAYEALARRATRAQAQRLAGALEREPGRGKVSVSRLETLAAERFPGGTVQGVSRVQVEDKFLLDVVPFGEPLVYVTQQGRPRVVLFGEDLRVQRHALASVWGDRFLLRTEGSGAVRVQYRAAGAERAVRLDAPAGLSEFVRFLAHKTTPERPEGGLSMTYSDVVGVLSAMCESGSVAAPFATEQDRLKAQLLSATASRVGADRPEKEGDEPVVVQLPAALRPAGETPAEKPTIVPIGPGPTKNR